MGREDVIPRVHGRDPVSPLGGVSIQLERALLQHSRTSRFETIGRCLYVPDQIHEDDARSPAAATEAKGSFAPTQSSIHDSTLSLRRRLPRVQAHTRTKYRSTRSGNTVYARSRNVASRRWRRMEEGGGDRGDRSRRVFTEPPRISHGKINLADTHREGDWTLDAVTGHGLQRLQQIACVKERTAINGCIIQYRGERGGGRGEGAGVCVSKCKRERRDANAKGPHHLERIEEPRNEALGIYIYVYIYIRRGISFLEEKREDLGRAWKPTTCMRVTKNDETARVRREEVAACLRCALHPVSSIGLLFDKRFAD